MRENIGFISACGLLWASVLFIGCAGESGDSSLLALLLVPVTLIGFVILFVAAVVIFFLRTQLSLAKRAVPFWFATVPVIAYAVVGTVGNEIRDENTWLTIKQYDFRGSDNFLFMKDGTYTQWRESPLGSSTEGSGRYERQDSVLTLRPELKNGKAQEVKLAIRPYSEFKRQQSSPRITLVTLDADARSY